MNRSLATLALTLLLPARVLAAPLPDEAPTSCPSQAAVTTELARLLPAAPTTANVTDLGDHYTVEVNGHTRDFADPARNCADRARKSAVFIAFTLEPPALTFKPRPPTRFAGSAMLFLGLSTYGSHAGVGFGLSLFFGGRLTPRWSLGLEAILFFAIGGDSYVYDLDGDTRRDLGGGLVGLVVSRVELAPRLWLKFGAGGGYGAPRDGVAGEATLGLDVWGRRPGAAFIAVNTLVYTALNPAFVVSIESLGFGYRW